MEVSYQLTVDDYRQAMKAYRTRTAHLRWILRFGIAFVLLVLSTGVVLLIVAPHSNAFQNLVPLYVLFLIWIVVWWGAPFLSARSQFRGSPSVQTPLKLEVTDTGLHFCSQLSDSRVAWATYVRWVEGNAVFVLFSNPKIMVVVPKRAFSFDQVNEFRELLRSKVKTQK
jgi:YcxB-like protein